MRLDARSYPIVALICAALACLLFVPGLGGGFIFDDKPNILQNTALHIQSLDFSALHGAIYSFAPSGYMRILAELTFALDYWRAGLDPAAFKATNIAIHGATTAALIYFFRQLLSMAGWPTHRAGLAALLMALAWAFHPLQVSSVLYVVQRMQTLGTLFLVLALWAYLKMRQAQLDDQPSRKYAFQAILFWLLALAGKEDSILFPVYTFALELTVLRYRAANPALARGIRLTYMVLCVTGSLAFTLFIAPHFWSTDAYAGRSFNSLERFLSQGRALSLYIGQILFPLPSRMPFYYDDFAVSRSLMSPPTTLPALLFVAALLAIAFVFRQRRALVSLGILLFFAGHFITSNVIGLELVFEHRNSFPLIGAVIAIADTLAAGFNRARISSRAAGLSCAVLIAILASVTITRSWIWGEPLRFAKSTTQFAPGSARAWNALCGYHFEQFEAGGGLAGDAHLDKAISACESGAKIPYSAASLSNIIIFKTMRGDVTDADWDRYLQRMASVPPSAENTYTLWVMLGSAGEGTPLDEEKLLQAIDVVTRRAPMDYVEFAKLGFFILERTRQQDAAFDYFAMSARLAGQNHRFVDQLKEELRRQGQTQWAENLSVIYRSTAP